MAETSFQSVLTADGLMRIWEGMRAVYARACNLTHPVLLLRESGAVKRTQSPASVYHPLCQWKNLSDLTGRSSEHRGESRSRREQIAARAAAEQPAQPSQTGCWLGRSICLSSLHHGRLQGQGAAFFRPIVPIGGGV